MTKTWIFKTEKIGMLTFFLSFSSLEITKKSTKIKEFQCVVTKFILVKHPSNVKSKCKPNLYFTPKIILIIDQAENCLFIPSFTFCFISAPDWRFSSVPAQARKLSACTKTCFFLKIKGQIILFELADNLKNSLSLVILDLKN